MPVEYGIPSQENQVKEGLTRRLKLEHFLTLHKRKMSYKISYEDEKWPRVIWIMRTWPCQKPFQFFAIISSIIISHPLGPWKANTWISCLNMWHSLPKGQHVWWSAILNQTYMGKWKKSNMARKGLKKRMFKYCRETITVQIIKPAIKNLYKLKH